ncbi:hypothetical protein K1719_021314 [Acacia pycnantha]|nr:hypothetical protein K1719_021314 [Acacia pycnantha]
MATMEDDDPNIQGRMMTHIGLMRAVTVIDLKQREGTEGAGAAEGDGIQQDGGIAVLEEEISCDPTTARFFDINLHAKSEDPIFEKVGRFAYMTGTISLEICKLDHLTNLVVIDWKAISDEILDCIVSLSSLYVLDLISFLFLLPTTGIYRKNQIKYHPQKNIHKATTRHQEREFSNIPQSQQPFMSRGSADEKNSSIKE